MWITDWRGGLKTRGQAVGGPGLINALINAAVNTGKAVANPAALARYTRIAWTAGMSTPAFVGLSLVRQPEASQHHCGQTYAKPLERLPPCY